MFNGEKDRLLKELADLRKENAGLKQKLQQKESRMEHILGQVVEEIPNPIVLTDFNGNIIYVNNRHQESIIKERKRLFALLDKLPVIVYLQANDYSIPFANQLFFERFGGGKGSRCYEIILGKKEPCERCEISDLFRTQKPQEWEWTDKGGQTYCMYSYPFNDYDGSLLLLVLGIDITKCKRVERALKKSEVLYRTVFENTGTATMICEEDTMVILVNSGFELLSGYAKEEIQGEKSWREFFATKDVEQVFRYQYNGTTCSDMLPGKYETRFVDRHGNTKNVLMTVALIPNTRKHVISLLDITEIKQFQKQMIRLEQLSLVGQMAAGIGHEVRNPMTTVRGFLQMFKSKEELTRYKEYIDLMIEELDRANSIITQFLSLVKDKPLEKKMMNLNSIIIKVFPLIQADIFKSNMYTQLELNNMPDLLLDEKEIRQLILNLVRNGIEEMSEGKMLTIKTFTGKNEVVLAVSDQGKGIKTEVFDKLGTPFLTTKEHGTGLGLAVCYSIADRHNATIDMKTGSGGSTFFVRFKLKNSRAKTGIFM